MTNNIFSLLMRVGLFLFWLNIGALSLTAQNISKKQRVLIKNVTVIDAVQGSRENLNVTIRKGKVKKIRAKAFKEKKFTQVFDGQGKFLIPGLWDTHVHVAYDTLLSDSMFDLFLKYGVTNIRDTGGELRHHLKWKKISEASPYTTPGFYFSGPLIDGLPLIYDGSSAFEKKLGVGADQPEEIRKIVNGLADQKVDFLKAYELLNPASFAALTAEARQRGLKVTGHVPLSMDVISAVDQGLNSIEHLRNIELACAEDWEQLLDKRLELLKNAEGLKGMALRRNIHTAQRDHALANQSEARTKSVIAAFKRNDTWQIPTLSIMTAASKRPWLAAAWQKTFDDLPTAVAKRWTKVIASIGKSEVDSNQIVFTQWLQKMTARLNEAAINIMAGTDCPIFFLTPGYSLHGELQLLVESGLSPMEALATATINPAIYFGLEKQLGSVELGKNADLILLNKNPLRDISNTLSISQVFRNGNPIISGSDQ